MANPFFVDSTVGDSLIGLGNVIGQKFEKEQALKEQALLDEQNANKRLLMQQELQEAMASGDPNKIASVSMKYPDLSKQIQDTFKFKNETTKSNFTQSMRDIISGGDPEQILTDRIQQIQSHGGDPSHSIQERESYRANPENYVKKVETAYALEDPKGYQAFKSATSVDTPEFKQGTGDMSGYAFNPQTGEYKINPQVKSRIEEVKSKPELNAGYRQSINKDFTQLTKDTKLIRNTASDLEKLAKTRSGPSAIAMIFKFMKALDPASVVREGEFATAESAAGMPETIKNTFDKVWAGERLGDEQIKQFVSTAKQLANSSIQSSTSEVQGFIDTFEGTLPQGFKDLLMKRIPQPFELEEQKEEFVFDGGEEVTTEESVINWSDL